MTKKWQKGEPDKRYIKNEAFRDHINFKVKGGAGCKVCNQLFELGDAYYFKFYIEYVHYKYVCVKCANPIISEANRIRNEAERKEQELHRIERKRAILDGDVIA